MLTYDERLRTLTAWMRESKRAVFFGGAGVSTKSGIPDFRSVSGLYSRHGDAPAFGGIAPETLLSHDFFYAHPDVFYAYHRTHICHPEAKPNAAHIALAQLEARGHLSCIVTQNIDGLHQAAGSKTVHELHGSVARNTCVRCGRQYALEDVMRAEGAPRCDCGGLIKPEVVLYGEALPDGVILTSIKAAREADMMIIGGTSLTVYPAAGLPDYYRGNRLVLINETPTPRDSETDLVFRESIDEVLSDAVRLM